MRANIKILILSSLFVGVSFAAVKSLTSGITNYKNFSTFFSNQTRTLGTTRMDCSGDRFYVTTEKNAEYCVIPDFSCDLSSMVRQDRDVHADGYFLKPLWTYEPGSVPEPYFNVKLVCSFKNCNDVQKCWDEDVKVNIEDFKQNDSWKRIGSFEHGQPENFGNYKAKPGEVIVGPKGAE